MGTSGLSRWISYLGIIFEDIKYLVYMYANDVCVSHY